MPDEVSEQSCGSDVGRSSGAVDVSVIIVSYNTADLLVECLESVSEPGLSAW